MQKLVSNMIIRAQPAIALQRLSATDIQLYKSRDLTATASATAAGQAPPLAAIDARPAHLREGACAMRNCMFIPREAAGAVRACDAHSARTLPALAAHLQSRGVTVYGAHMPGTSYDLSSLLPQRYVQQHMLFTAATQRRLAAAAAAAEREGTDTINNLLQVRAARPVLPCAGAARAPSHLHTNPVTAPALRAVA